MAPTVDRKASNGQLRNGILALMSIGLIAGSFRSTTLNAAITDYDALMMSLNSMSRATSTRSSPFLRKPKSDYTKYVPSKIEQYIISHKEELQLNKKAPDFVTTCHLWNDSRSTPYHSDMMQLIDELEAYYKKIEGFSMEETDIRLHLDDTEEDICSKLELVEGGLPELFPNDKLSLTNAGWVEPLLPPMRHPKMCIDRNPDQIANMGYLIHDFAHMCRQMKRTSRTVFVDMGASLTFSKKWPSPVLGVIDMFRKFGFVFDHIYAYEVTPQPPQTVVDMLPEHMAAAYHFINVGVETDPNSKQNPFKLLKENFNEDDLIIVKLDIDTPAIERALAEQLLNDEELLKLVDHLYFEHHVNQQELAPYWGRMSETVEESLDLFQALRHKGVATHFWT